jgi:hypothetical protein
MTQSKDFSPIMPSVWGLPTTWPLLQRLCEEDPQARGLLDVVGPPLATGRFGAVDNADERRYLNRPIDLYGLAQQK